MNFRTICPLPTQLPNEIGLRDGQVNSSGYELGRFCAGKSDIVNQPVSLAEKVNPSFSGSTIQDPCLSACS